MTFSLKPKFFLVGFLPGFLFVAGFILLKKKCDFHLVNEFAKTITLFSGVAIVIISFIIGQIFDSFRDYFIERLFNKGLRRTGFYDKPKIYWDFYFHGKEDEIDKMDSNFYLFYVININISLSLLALLIMIFFNWPEAIPNNFFISKTKIILFLIVGSVILVLDARLIRTFIVRLTNYTKQTRSE